MQLRLSLLLSAAATLPQAANAQGGFLTCVFSAVANGDITLSLSGDGAATMISTIYTQCCEESDDPTCVALGCFDYVAGAMVEPCTCGVTMEAVAAMKEDTLLASQIATMMPNALSATDAILEACCPTDETTATEVNTCYANLSAATTTTATESAVGTTTESAVTEPAATEPAATEPTESGETAPTPAAAEGVREPSSGSIASATLPFVVAYALFNYLM